MQTTKFACPVLPNSSAWIRLLRIDSSIAEEKLQEDEEREKAVPLTCTLQVFELNALPEYTALSYTCGKPVPDDLPEPHDRSEAIPFAEALHSSVNNWTQPEWHLKINKQRFHVARNLRDALVRLASSHLGRWVWVDAICIDQDDLDERSAQVQIMWIIYSSATAVRVWLGEEDETAVEAQLLEECLYSRIVEEREHRAEWADGKDMDPWHGDRDACLRAESVPMQWWWSWCHFYRRTWFERVWTMQEYILGKEVDIVCGSLHFNRKVCLEIVRMVKTSTWPHHLLTNLGQSTPLFHLGEPEMLRLETIRGLCVDGVFASSRDSAMVEHICGLKSTSTWLLMMLVNSRRRLVSDPRDRIYGMTGMITHVGGKFGLIQDMNWFRIDYSPSMSWEFLSILFALQMIMELPVLAYLSLVRYRPIETVLSKKLPSWVASLEGKDTEMAPPLGFQGVNRRAAYDASGTENMKPSLLWSRRDRSKGLRLVLKVLVVGEIVEILFEGPNTLEADLEDVLPPILHHMAHKGPTYTDKQRTVGLPETIWRTLIADSTNQCPAEADTALAFREWVLTLMLNALVRLRTAPEPATLERRLTQNLAYIDQIHTRYPRHFAACVPTRADILDANERGSDHARTPNWLQLFNLFSGFLAYSGRKLAVCTGGVLALVPREASKGDGLIIIAGARVPFAVKLHTVILDPEEGGKEKTLVFQFVGEAYVDGIMHGEVCESYTADGQDVPWQDFTFI